MTDTSQSDCGGQASYGTADDSKVYGEFGLDGR